MVGEVGRVGSRALIVFSLVTFTSSVVLPRIVESPEDEGYTPRPPLGLAPIIEEAKKRKPSLLTVWFISQFIFAGAMFLTPFVHSFRQAEVLVAIAGLYVYTFDVTSDQSNHDTDLGLWRVGVLISIWARRSSE